jgi:hypothetical protein
VRCTSADDPQCSRRFHCSRRLRSSHLAGGAQRDRVDEDHVVGRPPLGDLAVEEGFSSSSRVSSAPGFFTTTSSGRSSHFGVERGDARGHRHRRVRHRDVLEVDRADPLAAALDHVLAAVGDLHVAVGVDGATSPVGNQPSTSGSPPSPLKYCDTIHGPAPAGRRWPCRRGQLVAGAVDDLHVHAEHRAALLGLHAMRSAASSTGGAA